MAGGHKEEHPPATIADPERSELDPDRRRYRTACDRAGTDDTVAGDRTFFGFGIAVGIEEVVGIERKLETIEWTHCQEGIDLRIGRKHQVIAGLREAFRRADEVKASGEEVIFVLRCTLIDEIGLAARGVAYDRSVVCIDNLGICPGRACRKREWANSVAAFEFNAECLVLVA